MKLKRHTKVYYEFFGYTPGDFVPCEICEGPAVDVHHIDARGMGGNPLGDKDVPENLMASCRNCHDRCELIKKPVITKEEAIEIHKTFYLSQGKEWPED